jgi:hypothetical protein
MGLEHMRRGKINANTTQQEHIIPSKFYLGVPGKRELQSILKTHVVVKAYTSLPT